MVLLLTKMKSVATCRNEKWRRNRISQCIRQCWGNKLQFAFYQNRFSKCFALYQKGFLI